jgi:histidinol dehydrogenase
MTEIDQRVMLRIIQSSDLAGLARLQRARGASLSEAELVARRILAGVRRTGDKAVIRYAKKFDGLDLAKSGFEVSRRELKAAYSQVPRGFIAALRVAASNIRRVAKRQLPHAWRGATSPGVAVGQIVRPLERVACYVPGGRFPLPSTVLMSVIPAQVAGVKEIVITSPRPAPAVLVTADFLGIRRIFRLGGAQAIAAFAYGTRRVPRADKIVGPGNRFVAAAKKLVAGECGIDFIAGPSELVVAGGRGRAGWIAADLIAQAEHDPDAVAIFITRSRALAKKVAQATERMLTRLNLPLAEKALARQGATIVTRNLEEAIQLVNRFAPEHLTLLDDAAKHLDQIESAGSIFLGDYSAVAAGDYASGTNHILPTGGAARLTGGLSAAGFVKVITTQRLSHAGLAGLRRTITTLASTEGLIAHAHSVDTRFTR